MSKTTMTANEWEAAWEEYIEALDRYEAGKSLRFKRGHVREVKKLGRALTMARRRLYKLDPEFCERQGIWTTADEQFCSRAKRHEQS